MKKAFKFRIYPSREQRRKLEQTLETCRILYNSALAERRDAWEKEQRSVNYREQQNKLPAMKAANPYLPQAYSQVLQDALHRIDKSFKNFFRRVKAGEKPGYPRFKGRGRYDSFTYPQHGNGFELNGRFMLSKIGSIRIFKHREIEGEIKTCTIHKDVDRWFACFTAEVRNDAAPVKPKTAIGVDVGLESLVTLSTGEKVEPPKFLRKSEEKLARVHRKIRDQRLDFSHKLSRMLVNRFDVLAFEELNINGMVQNHHLAKSIGDACWGALQTLASYKAEWAGKTAGFVNPNGSSQECSSCGAVVHVRLADRTFKCGNCGFVIDRDYNAAINIRNRLLRKIGWDAAEFTPVEIGVQPEMAQPIKEAGSPAL